MYQFVHLPYFYRQLLKLSRFSMSFPIRTLQFLLLESQRLVKVLFVGLIVLRHKYRFVQLRLLRVIALVSRSYLMQFMQLFFTDVT